MFFVALTVLSHGVMYHMSTMSHSGANLFGTKYQNFDSESNSFKFSTRLSQLQINIFPGRDFSKLDESGGYFSILTDDLVVEFRNNRVFIKTRENNQKYIIERFEINWADSQGNYCENFVEQILLSGGRFFQLKYQTDKFMFCQEFGYTNDCDDDELEKNFGVIFGLEQETVTPIRFCGDNRHSGRFRLQTGHNYKKLHFRTVF